MDEATILKVIPYATRREDAIRLAGYIRTDVALERREWALKRLADVADVDLESLEGQPMDP